LLTAWFSKGAPADDVAEIVFTSGATAEPKGVIVTHRNLAANLPHIGAASENPFD
jgi:long-subunit acyl-CoA synthetase (AMP-forming)